MILPALIAAAVSESSVRPRARAHELRGRLGMREEKMRGTMARLAHIERQRGLLARRAAEASLIVFDVVGNYRTMAAFNHIEVWAPWVFESDGELPDFRIDRPGAASRFWRDIGFLSPKLRLDAPSGTTTVLDPILEWIGAQGQRFASPDLTRSDLEATLRILDNSMGVYERDVAPFFRQVTELGRDGYWEPKSPEERVSAFISEILPRMKREGLLDYLMAARPANLMAMSVGEVASASQRWHQQFYSSTGIGTPARSGVVVARWPDGGRIERLVTKKQVEDEGRSMAHCVGGYWPDVRDDKAIIYSYRDPRGVSVATVEVSTARFGDRRVEQVKAQQNDPVEDPAARARLRYYLAELLRVEEAEEHLAPTPWVTLSSGRKAVVVPQEVVNAVTLPVGWHADETDPDELEEGEVTREHLVNLQALTRELWELRSTIDRGDLSHSTIRSYLVDLMAESAVIATLLPEGIDISRDCRYDDGEKQWTFWALRGDGDAVWVPIGAVMLQRDAPCILQFSESPPGFDLHVEPSGEYRSIGEALVDGGALITPEQLAAEQGPQAEVDHAGGAEVIRFGPLRQLDIDLRNIEIVRAAVQAGDAAAPDMVKLLQEKP